MDGVIPQNSPSKTFLCAQAITLFLDMKKNNIWDESTTTEATDLAHGEPVSTAARHFLHLCSHQANPETTNCSYFLTKGALPKSVTITHIVYLLRLHAANIGFQHLGLYPNKIGPHSLRVGGAMTIHQAHILDSTIKIIGQWR